LIGSGRYIDKSSFKTCAWIASTVSQTFMRVIFPFPPPLPTGVRVYPTRRSNGSGALGPMRALSLLLLAACSWVVTGCGDTPRALAACRYEADKALLNPPPAAADKIFWMQEHRGVLVRACMEAKGYHLDERRWLATANANNQYVEVTLVREESVWDPPIFGRAATGPRAQELFVTSDWK
jgi:hypothetical protein